MTFSIDTKGIVAELQTVLRRLDDLVPIYMAVGEYAVQGIKERITHSKISPDGTPWAPWRPMTEELRIFKGNYSQGINWDSGALLRSITYEVDGNFEVNIGTDIEYATDVQNGDNLNRAERPIVGWSERDLLVIQECAVNYFNTGYARIQHG